MFYFVLACWMAAIQGYGRLCWHFCSVHEWLQPQLQQPWSLAGKVWVGFGRGRPHHESKAHSGTSFCKRFTSILMMYYILEPLELENYSTKSYGDMSIMVICISEYVMRSLNSSPLIFCPSSPALCFAQATQKNQTLADEMIMKTMVKAGHKVRDQWEKHHIRKLDTLTTIRRWSERETQIPPRK